MDIEGRIHSTLEDEAAIEFALLFGSRNDGSPRPDSDWDVAVYLADTLDARQRFDCRRRLSAALNGPLGAGVDVIVLNDSPPLLAHRALKGSTILMRDRAAYVRFFTRVMGEVEDERHFFRVHERARRERLAEGRFGRP